MLKMSNDLDEKIIRNSLLLYLIRSSLPYSFYTHDDFRKDETQIISYIKKVLDGMNLSIDDMLIEKEKEDHEITEQIIGELNTDFKKILTEKYNELYNRKIPTKLRNEVLSRDGYKCVYCGVSLKETDENVFPPQIDHVKSWRSGGKTKIENLVSSCWRCNLGKKDFDLFEYENDVETNSENIIVEQNDDDTTN